mmetsp:Transcript_19728/g.51355  ORF Transcript_19728/g.51355 Transcript_19728/m.51355 type:complete len:228 (-) Transcript_19728:2423-3106(-)
MHPRKPQSPRHDHQQRRRRRLATTVLDSRSSRGQEAHAGCAGIRRGTPEHPSFMKYHAAQTSRCQDFLRQCGTVQSTLNATAVPSLAWPELTGRSPTRFVEFTVPAYAMPPSLSLGVVLSLGVHSTTRWCGAARQTRTARLHRRKLRAPCSPQEPRHRSIVVLASAYSPGQVAQAIHLRERPRATLDSRSFTKQRAAPTSQSAAFSRRRITAQCTPSVTPGTTGLTT